MMTYSSLLYVGIFLFAVVGFAGIRQVGNTLTPPTQVAGTWWLTLPASSPSCRPLEFQETAEARLQIAQSGRYLHLTFTDAHQTKTPAYFDGQTIRGNEVGAAGCAPSTQWRLVGRLVDDRLELTFSPLQHTRAGANPPFFLVAARGASATRRNPPVS